MNIPVEQIKAKRFALIAFVVYVLSEIVSVIVFRLTKGDTYAQVVLWLSLESLVFFWSLPVWIVYKVERGDYRSLGVAVPHERRGSHAVYAVVGLVFPALVLQAGPSLVGEFVEQMIYIGLAEEFFYRGYLQARLGRWLGDSVGLLVTSLIFGLGHIFSKLAQSGLDAFETALLFGLQTFLGGLVLGYIYIRAKNIWPGAIFHIGTNIYLPLIL